MRLPSLLVLALVAGALLSGCSDKVETEPTDDVTTKAGLSAGRGGIEGLLVDDIYRPIPGCTLLLQGAGLTATSDAEGEFVFLDLLPGSYIAIASCVDHEAAPVPVDVAAGIYAELEVVARRIFSQDGRVLTAEFSAFIPCAADFVVNGVVANCLGDLSGDSYRPGFTSKNITGLKDVTYMVTEAKMNRVGDYTFQVREDNGSPSGGDRYAVAAVKDGDYVKIVNQYNVTNTEHNVQENNVPWIGDKPWTTILFYNGEFREEVNSVPDPANRLCCGLGAQAGIRAKFIQSIFLGEPTVPIEQYCVLAKSCT